MAAAQDGVVYIAGGYYDPTDTWAADSFQQTLYALDTRVENPVWEERATLPVGRGDGSLIAMGEGRLLLVGGETSAGDSRTMVCCCISRLLEPPMSACHAISFLNRSLPPSSPLLFLPLAPAGQRLLNVRCLDIA